MVGLVEAVLSPHTTLAHKSLRDLHFRERYGLSVLAIWRNGRIFRSDLVNMPLQFGDAFLLYGSREKINFLSREPDFLVLEETLPEAPRQQKASWAVLITIGVFASVVMGWLPLSIAALAGAAFMVLTGCLYIEELYQQVDWRLIFLIAGMAPLGIALERSGVAQAVADRFVAVAGGVGIWGLLIGLFVLTSVAAHFVPNVVVTLLLAPIALKAASDLGLSPYPLMMVIAIAASAGFMRPSAHPANMLIMGSGSYNSQDYLRVGIPLTVVVLLVVLLVLPLLWPF
jgi:di/tricarboxylate transporter